MLFRHHREFLEESIETVVEIKTMDDLMKELSTRYSPPKHPSQISFEHVGFDERIGWDTYNVLIDGRCIGMSNGNFE